MDPYLGPVAGAFLAAFAAGVALGVVRLHRLSLEWWRRRVAARRGAPSADPTDAATDADPPLDVATAPPVFVALALATFVALLGVAFAAGDRGAFGAAGSVPAGALVAPSFGELAARTSALVAIAALAFFFTLGCALLVSGLESAIARFLARFVPAVRATPEDEALDVPGLVAAARGAAEPFGVGFASIVLFASTVFAATAVLLALVGGPSPVSAVALALLAVPVTYAAAAERTGRPDVARLRRDAAVRQLAAAPAWAAGFAFAPSPFALAALAIGGALALPGAPARPGAYGPPWGGDATEPNPAVRTLSRVAHGAWIVILAMLPIVAVPAGVTTFASAALLVARIGLALVALLAARALVRRFVFPAPEPA